MDEIKSSSISKQVTIAGIGMGNPDLITKEVRAALLNAQLIIGSKRLKDTLPKNCQGEYVELTDGARIIELIESTSSSTIAVVMSGDSGFYSGTKGLLPALREKGYEPVVLPGISSISYLAARAGIHYQDAYIVNLHGNDENFIEAVRTHKKTFILMGGEMSDVVEGLCVAGLQDVRLIVGIKLSYPDEKIISAKASTLMERMDRLRGMSGGGLCVLFVINEKIGESYSFGIPDTDFIRGDVPMTKSEIRCVTASKMRLCEESIVYDIGAGTGTVSVEAALKAIKGRVYSIESSQRAIELLNANRNKFHVNNMIIVEGNAPEAFNELPAPDVVFIGGSKGRKDEIIKAVLIKNPTARIVMNAISLESISQMFELCAKYNLEELEIVQVSAARVRAVAGQHLMDGQNPIFVLSATGSGAVFQ